MGPIIRDINISKTLINPISIEGEIITEINIIKLILRPLMKRIVFKLEEINSSKENLMQLNICVYEDDLFEDHKDDSDESLIDALLIEIDNLYKI